MSAPRGDQLVNGTRHAKVRGAPASEAGELLVGAAWGAVRLAGRLAATGARIGAPILDLALWPPLVPREVQPGHRLQLMAEQWQRDGSHTLRHWSATAIPGALDAALGQVDAQRVVTVVLDRLNLDLLVADIVRRLDLDAIAATALDQVSVGPVVSAALDQIDLTQLVLDRVDLERVVERALDRLDLTAIVIDQVDLGGVVTEALQRVDLTQIVLQQVDLIGVAEYVVEGIDLPEIIRDSTGSVASEALRGIRIQGVDADFALGRVVDRVLHRRRNRRGADETAPSGLPDGTAHPPRSGQPA